MVRYLSSREIRGPTKNELDKATSMILSKKEKISFLNSTDKYIPGVDTMMK